MNAVTLLFQYFRRIFLFEFNRVSDVPKTICNVCEEMPLGTTRKWYSCVKEGHFEKNDSPHLGRLSEFDNDRLNALINDYPRQLIQELASMMNCDQYDICIP